MIYGYCRVSTKEQNLDRQTSALTSYKALDRIFSDKQSGKDFARDAYQELKSAVMAGDEVVVKELDRLGRNKEEVKAELEWFKRMGVVVREEESFDMLNLRHGTVGVEVLYHIYSV